MIQDGRRGQEIEDWYSENGLKYTDNILIIDDEIKNIKDYFDVSCEILEVNWYKGLTYFKSLEGIRKFKEQEKWLHKTAKEIADCWCGKENKK